VGDQKGAIRHYEKALEIRPDTVEALSNMGYVLASIDQLEEAESCCRKALALNAELAAPHIHLGTVMQKQGHFDEAKQCLLRAEQIDPDNANLHFSLGNLYTTQGLLPQAERCYRRAVEMESGFLDCYSNLLFMLNFVANCDRHSYLMDARRYAKKLGRLVEKKYDQWRCSKRPTTLRVGFVSGDYRQHPVAFFLQQVLQNLDRHIIEPVAFNNCNAQDDFTLQLKPHFSEWHSLVGLSHQQAAELVYDSRIHILVDLSGHTAYNRLALFAWKPAPVQVSWLSYNASTGLADIDYVIADEQVVPPGNQHHFVEKIHYLPKMWMCFTPPQDAPDVAPLPAVGNGHVTLGCFQQLQKINDEVLEVWSQILQKLPTARLHIQTKAFGFAEERANMRQRLLKHNLDPERVKLLGVMPRMEYLAAYAEVDFVLDTFPYNGFTTTCEALWMGVPTLTLSGETLLGRQGTSVMQAIDLPEWIAHDKDDYIDKALRFAGDSRTLAQIRAGFRERLLNSPLLDGAGFAQNLQGALQQIWQNAQPSSATSP
jgi:protein O-GlcNAc transferase